MHDDQHQDQTIADEARKPYTSPRLAVHGTVEALTRIVKPSGSPGDTDDTGTDADRL